MENQNIETVSSETINDIMNLQGIELELFNTLENGLANSTLTQQQQESLIEQINKISQMRISLYGNVDTMYQYYNGSVSNIEYVIQQQMKTILIVEKELNEAKNKLKQLEQEKDNKIRLVEINTYYSEKYSNNTSIMKVIVIVCVVVIILSILAKSHVLPTPIYTILVIIAMVIGIINIIMKLVSASLRDPMNYQETNYPSMPMNYDTSDSSGNNPWGSTNGECVGQQCCESGFTYVPSPTNMCLANSQLPAGVAPYSGSSSTSYTSTDEATSSS
jgi:hypothetical protein